MECAILCPLVANRSNHLCVSSGFYLTSLSSGNKQGCSRKRPGMQPFPAKHGRGNAIKLIYHRDGARTLLFLFDLGGGRESEANLKSI